MGNLGLYLLLLMILCSNSIAQDWQVKARRVDETNIIFISHTNGANERELAHGTEPQLSPDQTLVIFHRNGNLYIISNDGSNEQMIFQPESGLVRSPSWIPNGQKILFDINRYPYIDLYSISPDGTNPQLLVTNGALASRSSPAPYSPDMSKVLITKCFDQCFDLFLYDLTKGAMTQISNVSSTGSWSPDGQRIALSNHYFVSGVNLNKPGLYIIHVNGTAYSLLDRIENPNEISLGPGSKITWSPDGSKIAFDNDRIFWGEWGLETADDGVYEVGIDGKGLKKVDGHFPTWSYPAITNISEDKINLYDHDNSGVIDLVDFFMFSDHFGNTIDDSEWSSGFDYDNSGIVDFADFFTFVSFFGKRLN